MKDLSFFLSDEFMESDEVTEGEVQTLNALLPINHFTGKSFMEEYVLVDDVGERWLNWNGKPKHIIENPVSDMLDFF